MPEVREYFVYYQKNRQKTEKSEKKNCEMNVETLMKIGKESKTM